MCKKMPLYISGRSNSYKCTPEPTNQPDRERERASEGNRNKSTKNESNPMKPANGQINTDPSSYKQIATHETTETSSILNSHSVRQHNDSQFTSNKFKPSQYTNEPNSRSLTIRSDFRQSDASFHQNDHFEIRLGIRSRPIFLHDRAQFQWNTENCITNPLFSSIRRWEKFSNQIISWPKQKTKFQFSEPHSFLRQQ